MKDSSHSPSRRAFFFFFPPSLWKWRQNLYLPCAAAPGCTLANEHTIKQKTLKACSDFLHSCLAFITPTLLSLHQRNSWCSAKYLHLWVVHPRQAIFNAYRKAGNDLKFDFAHAAHDEHKSKGIMADINQMFVCNPHPLGHSLIKRTQRGSCSWWSIF